MCSQTEAPGRVRSAGGGTALGPEPGLCRASAQKTLPCLLPWTLSATLRLSAEMTPLGESLPAPPRMAVGGGPRALSAPHPGALPPVTIASLPSALPAEWTACVWGGHCAPHPAASPALRSGPTRGQKTADSKRLHQNKVSEHRENWGIVCDHPPSTEGHTKAQRSHGTCPSHTGSHCHPGLLPPLLSVRVSLDPSPQEPPQSLQGERTSHHAQVSGRMTNQVAQGLPMTSAPELPGDRIGSRAEH